MVDTVRDLTRDHLHGMWVETLMLADPLFPVFLQYHWWADRPSEGQYVVLINHVHVARFDRLEDALDAYWDWRKYENGPGVPRKE